MGAANALANPARLLKSLPGALYEAGVAVVVALTFAPEPDRGRPAPARRPPTARPARPAAYAACSRSDCRSWRARWSVRSRSRRRWTPAVTAVPPRYRRAVRRTTAVLTLGGLLGVCAGTYGLLTAEGGTYGLPVLLAGLAAALAGLWLGGRRSLRTRYRPDAGAYARGWSPRPARRSRRC